MPRRVARTIRSRRIGPRTLRASQKVLAARQRAFQARPHASGARTNANKAQLTLPKRPKRRMPCRCPDTRPLASRQLALPSRMAWILTSSKAAVNSAPLRTATDSSTTKCSRSIADVSKSRRPTRQLLR